MKTITEISQAMQQILTTDANRLARETKLIQRQRKVTGAKLSQTLVLGWLEQPEARLSDLSVMGEAVGLSITPQGLDQRFTPEACDFMEALLQRTLQYVCRVEPVAIPLLNRFNGVYLTDSSIITLPDALREKWPGFGGRVNTSASALKLQVRLDMLAGTLEGPFLYRGREHDRAAAEGHTPLPGGALLIHDLGYWKLADFRRRNEAGVYWLSRMQAQTQIKTATGPWCEPAAFLQQREEAVIDCDILLGKQAQVPARFIAVRVPQEVADQRRRRLREEARSRGQTVSQRRLAMANWNILVTNIPRTELTVAEALVLLRLRWQIELLFKLWKSHGGVDTWRSENPWRILCEIYAKLIALVIQHWCLVRGTWRFPDRSLVKAARTVRRFAITLAFALQSPARLRHDLQRLCRLLERSARKDKSRSEPRTYQRLLAVTDTKIP